jgi:hypothetical protein
MSSEAEPRASLQTATERRPSPAAAPIQFSHFSPFLRLAAPECSV